MNSLLYAIKGTSQRVLVSSFVCTLKIDLIKIIWIFVCLMFLVESHKLNLVET